MSFAFGNSVGHANGQGYGDIAGMDAPGAYSLLVVFKTLATPTANDIIFSKFLTSSGWRVSFDSGPAIRLTHGNGTNENLNDLTDVNIANGETHRFGLSWDGSNVTPIHNGTLGGTQAFTKTITANAGDVMIGNQHDLLIGFAGEVSMVFWWNRALSDQELVAAESGCMIWNGLVFFQPCWHKVQKELVGEAAAATNATVTETEQLAMPWIWPATSSMSVASDTQSSSVGLGLLSTNALTTFSAKRRKVYAALELDIDGTTHRFANAGIHSTARGQFAGRAVNFGQSSRTAGDKLQSFTTEVDIDDAAFDFSKIVEGSSGHKVRNAIARILLLSPDYVDADAFTWQTGLLRKYQRPPGSPTWKLSIQSDDLPLNRDFPKHTLNQFDWPDIEADALSKPAPILYGQWDSSGVSDKGALPCLHVDTSGFRYVVCIGYAKSVDNVYSDGTLLATSEYAIEYPITSSGRVWTVINFTSDQGTKTITCDAQGYESLGDGTGSLLTNPALQIKHLLVNFIYNDFKNGSWFNDALAPVDLSSFGITANFFDDHGIRGSRYIDAKRKGIEEYDEFVESWRGLLTMWTNSGNIAVLPDLFSSPAVYVSGSAWIREDEQDLQGKLGVSYSTTKLRDRYDVNYLFDAAEGKFNQMLQVRDPIVTDEAPVDVNLVWSEAKLV